MHPNDDLRRAIEALTIQRVWEAAGLPGPIPQGDGIVNSPFREERTGSFSVSKGGRVWKDFGGTDEDKGGVWKFAQRCWPTLSKRDLAERLIELSGIIPTPPPATTPIKAGTAGVPVDMDPRLIKAAKSLERRDKNQQAEAAIWRRRDEQLRPPDIDRIERWPDFVRERFEDGIEAMRGDPARIRKLADSRGWPEGLVWEILEQGLISAALEPMFDAPVKGARRQISFRVDYPEIRGSAVDLVPTGFHQRFVITKEGQPPEKKWRFVPAIPRPDGPRSNFLTKCFEYADWLKLPIDQRPAIISPQPFVLGDLRNTKLIVLLEGQWDAISFYGACGWSQETNPPDGIAVFGIRGVQGVNAFLGAWHRWLSRVRPNVWAIADNDRAGGAWRDDPDAPTGHVRPPSFSERLRFAGCNQIKISWLKPEHGKDFNDYYRAKKPSREEMLQRIDSLGLLNGRAGA